MKKIVLTAIIPLLLFSCNKIEETVTETVNSAKQKAQQKATDLVQETVNEQISKIVNAKQVKFDSIFPNPNHQLIENEVGKKVSFPNGAPFYIFKYKTGEKDQLLKMLVDQPTTNEAKSKKEFQKLDGASIVDKILFFEKFLPPNAIDTSFLDDIKNDKSIEYYKVSRFPNVSTVIYNPKTQMVYQFVEVKK